MALSSTSPSVFRGVIAIELRDGEPPQQPALQAEQAGEAAVLLGRDLAKLEARVRDCDLVLMAAHFDPAEILRPHWPVHQRVLELAQRAPGRAQGPRMIGFGADENGEVPLPLQADAAFAGGGLRVMPFVLQGASSEAVGAALEEVLFDQGMAEADSALLLQEALGARIEHVRYLSLHDLLAMMAMQYQHVGLDALWAAMETALLDTEGSYLLDAPPEPLLRYGDGEVRMALLDPAAWQQRNAPQETDSARLEHGFRHYQMRQRQYAAVFEAHGISVQFVHCAEDDANALC